MPMGKRAIPPSTRRFLAHVRTQSIGYQREVHSQLETIEGVLKGTVTVCTDGRVHTDWWQLRQVARVLKDDVAKAGFREAVALFERLCHMADQALLGLVAVGSVVEHVHV